MRGASPRPVDQTIHREATALATYVVPMTLWRWAVDVHSCGYFPLLVLLRYRSGTGTAGTGLQVLVLLVLSVYTAVLLATCIHLTSYPPSREGVDVVSVVEVASGAWLPMSRSFRDDVPPP